MYVWSFFILATHFLSHNRIIFSCWVHYICANTFYLQLTEFDVRKRSLVLKKPFTNSIQLVRKCNKIHYFIRKNNNNLEKSVPRWKWENEMGNRKFFSTVLSIVSFWPWVRLLCALFHCFNGAFEMWMWQKFYRANNFDEFECNLWIFTYWNARIDNFSLLFTESFHV